MGQTAGVPLHGDKQNKDGLAQRLSGDLLHETSPGQSSNGGSDDGTVAPSATTPLSSPARLADGTGGDIGDANAGVVEDGTGQDADTNFRILQKTITMAALDRVIDGMIDAVRGELQKDQGPSMLPTCLTRLPTGKETGNYVYIDLGGSTVRTGFVRLKGGDDKWEILSRFVCPVDDSTKNASGRDFFRFIASKVREAVDDAVQHGWIGGPDADLALGVSWSFPFVQRGLSDARFEQMGKGYTVSKEIAGWDVKETFESVLREAGMPGVHVESIVNDSGASVMSQAYADPDTYLALVLGTGINCSVLLPTALVAERRLAPLAFDGATTECLVNTEISMFGRGVIPETSWDMEVDGQVESPGFQPLETKVSGRYLGEISRLILRDMVAESGLCDGVLPRGFDVPWALDTKTMSDVEGRFHAKDMDGARELLLAAHPHPSLSDADLYAICNVFVLVSTRGAALTAAVLIALASLIPTARASHCTVACTGTVIEKYPTFRERCQQYLDKLAAPRGMKLSLALAYDGSILGPVIAAAMHHVS